MNTDALWPTLSAEQLLTDLFSARLMNAAVGASPHAIRASGAVAAPEAAPAPGEPTAEAGPPAETAPEGATPEDRALAEGAISSPEGRG